MDNTYVCVRWFGYACLCVFVCFDTFGECTRWDTMNLCTMCIFLLLTKQTAGNWSVLNWLHMHYSVNRNMNVEYNVQHSFNRYAHPPLSFELWFYLYIPNYSAQSSTKQQYYIHSFQCATPRIDWLWNGPWESVFRMCRMCIIDNPLQILCKYCSCSNRRSSHTLASEAMWWLMASAAKYATEEFHPSVVSTSLQRQQFNEHERKQTGHIRYVLCRIHTHTTHQ